MLLWWCFYLNVLEIVFLRSFIDTIPRTLTLNPHHWKSEFQVVLRFTKFVEVSVIAEDFCCCNPSRTAKAFSKENPRKNEKMSGLVTLALELAIMQHCKLVYKLDPDRGDKAHLQAKGRVRSEKGSGNKLAIIDPFRIDSTRCQITSRLCIYPLSSQRSMAVSVRTLSSSHTARGKKIRVKDWTNRWRRTWSTALVSSYKERKSITHNHAIIIT